MESKSDKRNAQIQKEQPGDMSSFNNRDEERSTQTEEVKSNEKGKDEGESNSDHKEKSEQNATAASK